MIGWVVDETEPPGFEAKPALRLNTPAMRAVWLNMNLGGVHWVHNDLTKYNLRAQPSCPVCRAFREVVWGAPKQRQAKKNFRPAI